MGIEWVVAGVVAVGMLGAFAYTMGMDMTPADQMRPSNMEAFNITGAEEGTVVTEVHGRVRVPGNILWYGNLKSVPVYGEAPGGKGESGGGSVLKGYKYYMDLWIALARGPVEIIKVYQQDSEVEDGLDGICDEWFFNDGTGTYHPTEPGENANHVPGVAHVFLRKCYLGFQVTTVPTFHFLIEAKDVVQLDGAAMAGAELANGRNPAAIILERLTSAGATADEINPESFDAAAAFWAARGYGLNMSFSSQQKVSEQIGSVLKYVGGMYGEDSQGRFVIKAQDPDEVVAATLDDSAWIELDCQRKSWEDVPNRFEGKFASEDQQESDRAVNARNPATIRLAGREISKSVDLTAFRDRETAARRLWEIMTLESYPPMEAHGCVFASRAQGLSVGSVVRVRSDVRGLDMDMRIVGMDLAEIDEEKVALDLVEAVERVVDDSFTAPAGGPGWTPPRTDPVPLTHAKVLELPRNPHTGSGIAVAVLAARELGTEDGLVVQHSNTGTDYETLTTITTWSQRGVLTEDYTADTYTIDDEVGFLYEPYREDPVFPSLSRTDLFARQRVAIVDDEIMGFQTVQLQGDGTIRLVGIIRGMYHTPVQDHAAGAEIWLTRIHDNVLELEGDCSLLLLPSIVGNTLDPSEGSPIAVDVTGRAAVPWSVARIEAVRVGNEVIVRWWPCDVGLGGAGLAPAEKSIDQWPPEFSGDFLVNGVAWAACEKTYTYGATFDVSVAARQRGQVSEALTITVPAEDGTYYA